MAEGKIQFQLGRLSFSGEGTEQWVASQLEFLLSKIPELTAVQELDSDLGESEDVVKEAKPAQVGSLASHIKSKGGESNQTMRFLATADWLRLKGEKSLKTSMIGKALQDNHQKKLANPADCLNKNVAKGFCEKAGETFFITPEGKTALGHKD